MSARLKEMKIESSLLPEDIMMDIFLRFSVREISVLRCVCKSWNSLITSASFAECHLSHSIRNNPREIFFQYGPGPSYLSFYSSVCCNFVTYFEPPFHRKLADLDILGSCNGVLCFSCSSDCSNIYLWNPSTTKYKILRKPSMKPRYVGFGVDSMSGCLDDFKVVTICTNGKAEVYNIKTDEWKCIEQGFPACIEISSSLVNHPVFVSGSVHWCARVSCYYDNKCPWLIMSFDFTKETFQMISLPNDMSQNEQPKTVNVMNGHLCIFASISRTYFGYELWVMKEYGVTESWTKLYEIERENVCFWPLGFSTKGKVYVKGGCEHEDISLLKCDPNKKRFKCLGTHSSDYTIQVLPFAESLVSPSPRSDGQKKLTFSWLSTHLGLSS